MSIPITVSLFARDASWQVGDIKATFAPDTRRFLITTNGRTFEPLAGAGPILVQDEKSLLPKAQHATVEGAEQTANTFRCDYRIDGVPLTLEIRTTDSDGVSQFRFRWQSPETVWAGVSAGVATGLGRQRPFFFNRASESYGQATDGCTFYCADAGLWLFADWDVSASNLTTYRKARTMKPAEINTNFPVDLTPEAVEAGDLPFAIAGDSVYAPDTSGQRLALDDTLVLRIGKTLWDTVPTPPQPASPYREELAKSAFLDVWGGYRARDLEYTLQLLEHVLRGRVPCHTILQNWQCGGFDTLQPLSLRMPDYPPNPHIGTVDELRQLCETGKRLGRFGFRTNYVYCKTRSPVVASGEAHLAVNPDGSPRRFVRFSDVLPLAQRQEAEIADLFNPNCTFSDQLGSAGNCSLYVDHNATVGTPSLRETWARIKEVCRLLRQTHNGPLSSETLCGDFLLGGWIDAGDFGMFGGHCRALAPDYKLRKLQHLTAFHGMALGYRFFFAPPYAGNDNHQKGEAMYLAPGLPADDYRACEVLYGNGAYLYLLPGMSWRQILGELIVIGRLQRHYALVPVTSIEYYQTETKQWLTLEELARRGVNVTPVRWIDQTPAMQIARVRYTNGLEVTVNRSATTIDALCGKLRLRLPQAGWCAATPAQGMVAFSAFWPGTDNRVDYMEDKSIDWRFLDPRSGVIDGVECPTLSVAGTPVVELLANEQLRIDGKLVPDRLPSPPPLEAIDFDFTRGTHGWHAARDILRVDQTGHGLSLHTCGRDPYLIGPGLNIAPGTVTTLVIRLRSGEPGTAAFFWQTTDATSFRGGAVRTFKVEAGETFRDYRVPVGDHPAWRGKAITCLRFDPLAHDGAFEVEIQSIRGE